MNVWNFNSHDFTCENLHDFKCENLRVPNYHVRKFTCEFLRTFAYENSHDSTCEIHMFQILMWISHDFTWENPRSKLTSERHKCESGIFVRDILICRRSNYRWLMFSICYVFSICFQYKIETMGLGMIPGKAGHVAWDWIYWTREVSLIINNTYKVDKKIDSI